MTPLLKLLCLICKSGSRAKQVEYSWTNPCFHLNHKTKSEPSDWLLKGVKPDGDDLTSQICPHSEGLKLKLALRKMEALEHTHLKAIKIDCEWLSRYVKSISDSAAWGCLCQFSLTALELRWHVSAAVSEFQYTITHIHTNTHLSQDMRASLLSLFLPLLSRHSPVCVPRWTKTWYSRRNGLPPAQTAAYIICISAQTGRETPR